MKLLIYSHFFAPSVGGVETIVLSLARGLAELRDSSGAPQFETTLVTQTPSGNYDDRANAFRTVRTPSFVQLWQLVRSSDVVHVAGPALAPLFLVLFDQRALRSRVGEAAAKTVLEWTWERNAAMVWDLLKEVSARKHSARVSQDESSSSSIPV